MQQLDIRKHGKHYKVYEIDSRGNAQPNGLSVRSFPDNYYTAFFSLNNTIVASALELGLDLGTTYSDFYTQGLRISQQLPGPLRQRNIPPYKELCEQLKATIVGEWKKRRISERRVDLERIVAPEALRGVPESDQSRLNELVKQAQDAPIIDARHQAELDFSGEVNFYSWQSPKSYNPPIADRVLGLAPALRADFAELALVGRINGPRGDNFQGPKQQDEFVARVRQFTEEQAKSYLAILVRERRRYEGCFYHFQLYVDREIDHLSTGKPHTDLLLELLERAQKENLPIHRELLPVELAALLNAGYSIAEIHEFATTAFTTVRSDSAAAIKFVDDLAAVRPKQ